jgi:hypothetical protein
MGEHARYCYLEGKPPVAVEAVEELRAGRRRSADNDCAARMSGLGSAVLRAIRVGFPASHQAVPKVV